MRRSSHESMLRVRVITLLSASLAGLLAAEPPPPQAAPPGGYWSLAETREHQEPPTGDKELTIGSVLFSLGLIRAGAGAVTVWMASKPNLCPASSDSDCQAYGGFGWYGVAEGGALTIIGIVYLSIGASQRNRHTRWQAGGSAGLEPRLVGVRPWLARPRQRLGAPTGGGLVLELRF
ncbi:hypothetical protein G6O69_03815 [Pseudenhygromyxa sp. WMMC2535]|uniref:hypothetical protein n=1 Tax=Pseudenhygromyxa sp. WMMC2535 TaxID=2712867 RepID=UPI0015951A51|nr:hypothetical protein [Pseudenhygromyxa sp. WMMC2535]NVB36943.1 hypothetical protein [Pseudenhygromyxa sp. WMMC2535]